MNHFLTPSAMETDVKIDNIICRCCLHETSDPKNMLQEILNDGKMTLLEGYTLCSGVELMSDNNYKNICRKCEQNLKISFDFRKLCRDSNEVLLERAGLPDLKTEEISDTEETGQDSFVYSEYTQQHEMNAQTYRHQVFVKAIDEKSSISEPTREMKIEEIPSKPVVTKEAVKEPENISVDVILKGEGKESVKKDTESDDDIHQDPDYESYDDNIDVKAGNHAEHSGSENFDTFLLEGNYACPLCELVLNNFRDFKSHRKTHLWDSGLNFIKRTCEICNQFTDKYLYHIKYEHPDHKPNTCRQCGMCFNQPNQLHKHLLTHLKGKRFPCKGCKRKFVNTIQLKIHISKTKHFRSLYQCQECGMTFPVYKEFLEHFNKTHHEDTTHRKYYPCIDCKNIFYRRQQAHKHNCDPSYSLQVANMNEKEFTKFLGTKPKTKRKKKVVKEEVGGVKLHKCDRCSERFLTEDEMVCHQHSQCVGKIRHICDICDKEFKKSYYLIGHKKNIHDEKTNICDVCGSTWASEHTLKQHKRIVHSVRSCKCDCGASFKSLTALKGHQKTHKKQEFECFHCGKKFISIPGIDRHMTRHMVATEKSHKCSFCEKTFRLFVDKRDHEKTHKGKMFPCHLCENVYSNVQILNHHIEFNHEKLSYVCSICQQSISHKCRLSQHYFLHRGFKPYCCKMCPHQDLTKDRFKKHLKKLHNIEYVESEHGYVEKNPNIRQIVEAVFKISTKEPVKRADSTQIQQFGDDGRNSFLDSNLPRSQHDGSVKY